MASLKSQLVSYNQQVLPTSYSVYPLPLHSWACSWTWLWHHNHAYWRLHGGWPGDMVRCSTGTWSSTCSMLHQHQPAPNTQKTKEIILGLRGAGGHEYNPISINRAMQDQALWIWHLHHWWSHLVLELLHPVSKGATAHFIFCRAMRKLSCSTFTAVLTTLKQLTIN